MPRVLTVVGLIIFVVALGGGLALVIADSGKRGDVATIAFAQYVMVAGAVLAGAGVVAQTVLQRGRGGGPALPYQGQYQPPPAGQAPYGA